MKVSTRLSPSQDVQHQTVPSARSIGTGEGLGVSHEGSGDVTDPRISFRAIYDTWFEDVARWIRALGGLEADRDDILQEVFLVVRRRLDSFDGRNPAGWLYRITRRQVRDFRRRTWVKHIFTKQRSDDPDILAHGGINPASALEHKEKQRILYSLLENMSEDRRCAFVLFEIEGLSGEEISRIQSVPVNTVWTRLHHARREFFVLAARYQKAHEREFGSESGKESRKGNK
jgi:RNA polymerase sigma-70 factor (ECF subfamily)